MQSLCCNENYLKKFDDNLKKWFFDTYKFSNHDINKFILLLWKSVYPYEYMDDWDKFNEISLPVTEGFYSNLNMEPSIAIFSITIFRFSRRLQDIF